MLSILMVTPRFPPDIGGVERHVAEVASRLVKQGVSVHVLCTDRTGDRLGTETRDGIRVTRVRAWPSTRDYYVAPGLWLEMAKSRYDIVHVQSYHTAVAPLVMARAIRDATPFVLTFHGGGHSSALRHRMRGLQRRVMRPLIGRAARLIAVAHFEMELYGRDLRLPPERFVLIPNGVDSGAALPVSPELVVASIGRLERYKGHHKVLDAFPVVRAARPGARLCIVGVGPQEAALRAQAARLGVADSVDFMHFEAEDPAGMASLLARTRVVVSLSEFETHPLMALEAVAAGRQVVVADHSGLGELVRSGLATAVPVGGTDDEVAEVIIDCLDHETPVQTESLTTWDECALRLLDLYREVACGS